MRHDAHYIDNTIATIRNHQSADNPWPGWANALADAVEDERARAENAEAEFHNAHSAHHNDIEAFTAALENAEDRVTKLKAALERITEFPARSVCAEAWDIAVGALDRIDVASKEEA